MHGSHHICISVVLHCLQQHLLDRCVRESDHDHNSPEYHVTQMQLAQRNVTVLYNLSGAQIYCLMYCIFLRVLQIEYSFKWLQASITAKKTYDDLKSLKYQPLPALNVRNFISQVYI